MAGSKKGERRGGRQKGTPNKRTGELIERAEASGAAMPADMMLDLARDAYERWQKHRDAYTGMCLVPTWSIEGDIDMDAKPEKVEVIDWGKRAMGYAAECAPYYHATLKAIDATLDASATFIIATNVPRDDQDD